uniref:Putative serine/threonine-protein kinase ddb isoform x1 n=1 Tax=Lutzomyia longipalpis TaxID=7200 RepID=A0A7G3AWH3_LUTLO
MSPERPPSQDGGPMLESPSLIMSSMPIESSHVILQQHIQYSNPGIGGGGDGGGGGGGHIVINGNGMATGSGGGSRSVNGQGVVAAGEQTGSSKLLVLQQTGENYIAASPLSFAANENNGVGNIVLLATEQMDVNPGDHNGIVTSANGGDEELTPLTWLHNKDLLKGINLSCAKVQSNSDTLIKQNTTGAMSPTSDFLEDSCISEDNTSSIVSNSDQSIGIYSTETSPKLYISPNNNNNTINKNRNHLTTSTRTSAVQVSPGGTTTVIEYHSSGKQQQHNGIGGQAGNVASSTGGASTSTTSTTTTTSTPHQHFHKKYLREEHVKTLRQNQNDSGFVSPTTVGQQQYESPPQQQQHQAPSPTQPASPLRHRSGGGGGGQSQKTHLATTPSKHKHPTNQPYDPQVHTTNKPPFSFSSLIFMAIEDASEKALPVKEIYAWIVRHFPYFKTAPTGWKNSVRHNLSLNKCFQKVEKAPNMGKGSLWRVEQQYRQNLIQALTRSPFHPFSTNFDKTVYKTQQGSNDSSSASKSSSGRPLNASLTPRLSKFMAELDAPPEPPASPPIEDEYRHLTSYSYYENGTNAMLNVLVNSNENGGSSAPSSNGGSPEKIARDWGADSSIEDVNAATAMLALKHGPKVFAESFQNGRPVITSSPSEDHTYSAGGNNGTTSTGIGNLSANSSNSNSLDNTSNGTSSDAAYESSEESQMTSRAQEDLEEQRRKAEGVDALLNLAGVSLPPTAPIMLKRSSVDNQFHYQTSSTDAETPLSSPSPSKRSKQRPIRTKLKKKAAWLR